MVAPQLGIFMDISEGDDGDRGVPSESLMEHSAQIGQLGEMLLGELLRSADLFDLLVEPLLNQPAEFDKWG